MHSPQLELGSLVAENGVQDWLPVQDWVHSSETSSIGYYGRMSLVTARPISKPSLPAALERQEEEETEVILGLGRELPAGGPGTEPLELLEPGEKGLLLAECASEEERTAASE